MYKPVDHPPKKCNWCHVEFKPRTKHQNFCSKGHYKKYGKKYLGHSAGDPEKIRIRKRGILKRKKRPYRSFVKDQCERCGFVPEHLCQLDVDHIDQDHKNNAPENLQTLCANCHRLKTYQERLNLTLGD